MEKEEGAVGSGWVGGLMMKRKTHSREEKERRVFPKM